MFNARDVFTPVYYRIPIISVPVYSLRRYPCKNASLKCFASITCSVPGAWSCLVYDVKKLGKNLYQTITHEASYLNFAGLAMKRC